MTKKKTEHDKASISQTKTEKRHGDILILDMLLLSLSAVCDGLKHNDWYETLEGRLKASSSLQKTTKNSAKNQRNLISLTER